MSWIRLEDNYSAHRKTAKFARLMGNPLAEAYLTRLWTWASACQPDGNLSGMEDADIADAVRFPGDPATLGDALRQSGFLDPDGMIHDWDHYQGAVVDKRNRDRARAAEERAKRKIDPPVQAESRDGSATVAGASRDGSATVAGPSRPTVRYGTVRDGTQPDEEPSAAPAAVAAVPTPEGKPVQEPLLALPEKPKKPRKLTDEQAQANAWRSKALAIACVPEAEAGPWPSDMFLAWKGQVKRRSVETLMKALDGIARLPPTDFNRKRGWTHWLSGEGIDAGLAALSAPNAPAASRGAFPTPGVGSVREQRDYSKSIEPTPVVEWTPEGALQRALLTPDFLGPKRLIVPWGKSLPDGFQIPDGVVVVHGQKPVSTSPLLDGARGVA